MRSAISGLEVSTLHSHSHARLHALKRTQTFTLLVTDRTTEALRQRIARLQAHEVCHQWFGSKYQGNYITLS